MKRLLLALALILLMTLSLTACPEDEGSNDEIQEELPSHTHVAGDWVTNNEVTCNTNGNRYVECIECHEIIDSEIIYAVGHKMKDGACTVCGKSYSTGLGYTSLGSGECYVSNIGSCHDSDLFVPPTSPDGEKVVSIGEGAFYGCDFITGVELSDTITTIESFAFYECIGINNVFLGKNVTKIGEHAFTSCENLQSIRLGELITEIGFEAFGYCGRLMNITIPDCLTVIEENTFINCGSLLSISFGDNCRLESIGYNAFRNCYSLGEIVVPDSVKLIEASAFYNCSSLKSVVIGSGVDTIEEFLFTSCEKLESVDLGNVSKICYEAFGYCNSLQEITIPDSVKVIEDNAFINCRSLTSVSLGKGSKLENIGEFSFYNCRSLKEIVVPDSVLNIGISAFNGCSSLVKAVIGNGVTAIKDYTFTSCENLEDVRLGSNILEIGSESFGYCKRLKNLVIPKAVHTISNNAFIHCEGLETVSFAENSDLSLLAGYAFYSCSALREIVLPDNLIILGEAAFSNCSSLTRAVVGDNVVIIEDYAFAGCSNLVLLEIKEGVSTIDYQAFEGCSSLTNVIIPANVLRIEKEAFANCKKLSQTILPESLEFVGYRAFDLSQNRILYYGNEGRWKNIDFDGDRLYEYYTPYYFMPFKAPFDGDYWGFDSKGEVIIWGLTADAVLTDYYSKYFIEECLSERTYGSIFLDTIEDEMMAPIILWNSVYITANMDFIFDSEHKLITKKDIYKYVLYDLLTGEHAEESFFDAYEKASMNAYFDMAKIFLGEIKIEDFKIGDLDSVLKNIEDFSASDAINEVFDSESLDAFLFFMEMSENAHEATQYFSRYYALRDVQSGYMEILNEIIRDGRNPQGLRDAAYDLMACYEDAFKFTPEEFVNISYDASNIELINKTIQKKAFDFLKKADPTGILTTIEFEGKIVMALMDVLGINEMVNSYYKLKCLVAIEQSIMSIIKPATIDFYKYENRDMCSSYMSAVNLLEKVVLMENNYSMKFFKDYYYSVVTDESLEKYRELSNKIIDKTSEYKTKFKEFDIKANSKFEEYYVASCE